MTSGDHFAGLRLPGHGDTTSIFSLYRRSNGDLVVDYLYKSHGKYFVDFYDIHRRRNLAPQMEAKMAASNEAVRKVAQANALHLIQSEPIRLDLGGGLSVTVEDSDGTMCLWPYDTSMQMVSNGRPVSSIMILVRRQVPKVESFERDCDNEAGTFRLRTKYAVQGEMLSPDGGGGFYVTFPLSPYLIHFDHHGHSAFFRGRADIVEVSADAVNAIRGKADETDRSQQHFVTETDRLIARAAEHQRGLK